MKLLLPPFALPAMRVLVLLLLFASCKKTSVHVPVVTPATEDKSKNYVGTYRVLEDALVYYPAGENTHTEFTGHVIRDHSTLGTILPNDLLFSDTLNVISFVQSGRDPAPEWSIPGRDITYGSDTITFKIFDDPINGERDTIISAYGNLAEVRIVGKDSLSLNYYFGLGYVTYQINQTWVKN